jgi:ATP-dependent helicase/nuclease subunit B
MRHQLGLDLPERRIGLSAHDFAEALGAPEVILTRAAKLGGTPTVASRFVQRLAAVAGEARWQGALARGARYVELARRIDTPAEPPRSVTRPEPRPPREARPTSLSVTEIELWLRDPYSIYARHVLDLRPLDAVDTPPGARDRGTVVHGAIGDFTAQFKDALPDNIVAELLRLGEQHFLPLQDFPDAKAFWWPRFERIAQWFADFEKRRRPGIRKLDAELHGTIEIPLKDRIFTLRSRADRIEHRADGRYAILDYKTGQVPTAPQVKSGLAPQLTLEGAILRAGRFGEIQKGASIAEFLYIALRGISPPGEPRPIIWKDSTPDAEADTALRRLSAVVARFDDPDTPYRSRERPMFLRRGPGDYDHLARVKEWSLFGDADDGEAGGE